MKKIIVSSLISSIMLLVSETSFAQQDVPPQSLKQVDFLTKSKKQKKTGMIFLGGGATLIVASLVIPQGEPTGFQISPITGGFYEGHKNDGIKGALVLTGGVSILGSIPFFLSSGKNKKRAMAASVSIDIKKLPVIQQTAILTYSYPALAIKINL